MGEWIRKLFSDSVSQSAKQKGEDASNEQLRATRGSFRIDRSGSTRNGETELEDILDIRSAISGLLSSLLDVEDMPTLTEVLSRELPAIIPFDIGTLRWNSPDSGSEDPLYQVEDDFPESAEFIALGSILEGASDVRVQGPEGFQCDGTWSGHMDGICRARTMAGEPLLVRMHSGLIIPLNSRDGSIGVILLFSTREGAMDGKADDEEMRPIWNGIGSTLRRILGSIDAMDELQRTRELLNSSDELLVLWKEAGNLWEIDCNSRAESFIQKDRITPEMMEGPFFAPPGKEWDRAMSAWRKAFEEGGTDLVELKLVSVKGERIPHLCIFSPYQKDDDVLGVRMTGIPSDFLMRSMAMVRSEEPQVHHERVDLFSLIGEEICSLGEDRYGMEVQMEPPTGPLEISGHPMLRVAFRSLLERARELSLPGHAVSVGISTDIRGIKVSIKCKEIPTREEVHEDASGGGSGTKEKIQYARCIIELHGGSLDNGSKGGEGSMFRVMLPWSTH
ncbi:MAG: HAMP domain-containing histidine kinase [Candidatus Thermoplasmatota archaeon]|nr:HAMP domain-containing histidine kinase [Candidatus Thermoplasmatota archaeon]